MRSLLGDAVTNRITLLIGVMAVLAGACKESSSERVVQEAPVEEVFGEHRQKATSVRATGLGEDCSDSGEVGCVSGVCLHVKAAPGAGYVCSKDCREETACPAGWRCGTIHPQALTGVCIPPADWVPRLTDVRGANR